MRKLAPLQNKESNILNTKASSTGTTGIYAAALQDHLIRNSNLKLLNKLSKPIQPKKHNPVQKIFSKGRVISIDHQKGLSTNQERIVKKSEAVGVIKEYENTLKDAEVNEQKIIQIKLAKYINKLTLAQKLGLVEKPPQPLSNNEWVNIEETCKKRDSDNSCSICLEGFRIPNNQVILSCTHVFHKACLSNFEKFTNSRVCPLCRRQDYEKKNFDQGFINHLTKQIVKLQKIFRGYLLRKKLYSDLNKTYKATSTLFRRRLLAYKLQLLNEKMQKKVRIRQRETEKLIVEIDKNLDEKVTMADKIVEMQNIQRQTQENIREAIPNANLIRNLTDNLLPSDNASNQGTGLTKAWLEIYKSAASRNEKSCAICFNDLKNGNKLCLLNCTHVFHSNCLHSFEYYSLFSQHTCPVCRSDYKKLEIDHW